MQEQRQKQKQERSDMEREVIHTDQLTKMILVTLQTDLTYFTAFLMILKRTMKVPMKTYI
jgi:hypothetical protein